MTTGPCLTTELATTPSPFLGLKTLQLANPQSLSLAGMFYLIKKKKLKDIYKILKYKFKKCIFSERANPLPVKQYFNHFFFYAPCWGFLWHYYYIFSHPWILPCLEYLKHFKLCQGDISCLGGVTSLSHKGMETGFSLLCLHQRLARALL